MAISLYSLNTQTWVNTGLGTQGSDAATQLLLVNILIEMRVQTIYWEALSKGVPVLDDPQSLRVDITQEWPVNG